MVGVVVNFVGVLVVSGGLLDFVGRFLVLSSGVLDFVLVVVVGVGVGLLAFVDVGELLFKEFSDFIILLGAGVRLVVGRRYVKGSSELLLEELVEFGVARWMITYIR